MTCSPAFQRNALRAVFFVLLWAVARSDASAQTLSGRVLVGDRGVAGQEVVLHRVSRDTSGTVGTTVTDREGRFTLALPPVDTVGFTVFFATVEYQGIRHFGYPLHPGDDPSEYVVAVHDTVTVGSEAAPALRIARRDIVMLPERDGGWEVNELLRLVNPGERTLVASDGKATWEFRIPPGTVAFELGEGEIGSSELVRMEDRALLAAPLLPGTREVFLRYRVPAGHRELLLGVGTPTDSINLFVREPSPTVEVRGMRAEAPVRGEAGDFRSFGAADLDGDATLTVVWKGPAAAPISPTAGAIGIVALFLVAGLVAAFLAPRRREPHAQDHEDDGEPVEPEAAANAGI
jgi:hypothetical protein